jgi:hypothetical protein
MEVREAQEGETAAGREHKVEKLVADLSLDTDALRWVVQKNDGA